MSGAFETFIVCDEHFPTPDFPVGAIAGAIEDKADHATGEVVLRHATRNVGVVVLHADDADTFHRILFDGPFCGEILGMQIVGDDLRPNFENAPKMLDGLMEKTITFDIFQISNVLT